MRSSPGIAREVAALGDNALHVSVGYGNPMEFSNRAGLTTSYVQKELLDGRLPMPHVRSKDGDLFWEEDVYAHLLGRDFDEGMSSAESDVLVIHAKFTVRNTAAEHKAGHLWLHFGDTSQIQLGYKAGESDQLGWAIPHRYERPFGLVADRVRYVIPTPRQGKLIWHDNAVQVGAGQPAGIEKLIEWQVPLTPGEQASIELILPYQAIDRSLAKKLIDLDSESLSAKAASFWTGIIDRQGKILTPDSFVNDYLAAVVGQMAQQLAFRRKERVWMYKTSPNHYEMYWPCNGAKGLPTFDLRGLSRYSRPVLSSFIATQSSDVGNLTRAHSGKEGTVSGEGFAPVPGFLGNFGDWTANTLLLSHGLEMWALASHYRITRDDQWLRSGQRTPLQAILDACDWLAAQRRRTMREEAGRKVPHWGLLPAASAHDWLTGNTIFNDAFCIFGMIESVRLLREINHPRTGEIALELKDYRKCLRDRYREATDRARRVPIPGGTDLPYVPRDVYELDWAKIDWTYTGYGPLRAGAWGALDPYDELVNQSLAFLEAGMPRGEGVYFNIAKNGFGQPTADRNFLDVSDPGADRHFLWRHYVEYETMWPIGFDLFLQRDDLPRFFEWFFNNLAAVIHGDYRVGVESLDGVPSCAPGEAERWRAVRNMFVNERGGYDGSQQSLWLLQAIPRSWLQPGSQLGVTQMGTHFGGHIDLEARVPSDGRSLKVTAKLNLRVAPTEIRMRLRSGDGRRLRSARVNGKVTPALEKDTIRLPGEMQGQYEIVAYFE
jgi:hypothetical protein